MSIAEFLDKLHPERVEKRSTFLSLASRVGESAFALLNALNSEEEALEDQHFYFSLNDSIQTVANSTANLVLQCVNFPTEKESNSQFRAKSLPGLPGDSPNERVIHAATQVALFTRFEHHSDNNKF